METPSLNEVDQIQESTADQIGRLKAEFCSLLSSYTASSNLRISIDDDQSSSYADTSSCSTPPHFSFSISSNVSEMNDSDVDGKIDHLRCIAERIISAGVTQDCVESYYRIRRQAMDVSLLELGIEEMNSENVQIMDQQTQAWRIRRWIKAARTMMETIFKNEKLIVYHIFNCLSSEEDPDTGVDEICFALTVKSAAVKLFNFAATIIAVPAHSAPERLFPLLDLYEVLSELLPDINTMFGGKLLGSIHEQAARILTKVADVAKGMFEDFEKSLMNEKLCRATQTGDVLPLTKYVMDFLKRMSVYERPLTRLIHCLNELIVSKPSGDPSTPEMDLTEFEEQAPVALHLNWIILILHFNLEGKSKHYKDVSLSHLFIMNNGYCIVQEITAFPELREMIGDEYLRKLTGTFRQASTSYLRSTWAKVLHCLEDNEALYQRSGGVSRSILKERFKGFHTQFEKVHRTQATWIVPNTQLREELRVSMSEIVVTAYRSFLGRFEFHICSSRHPQKYIKYSEGDVEDALLDLLEGYPVSQPLGRRA